MVKQYQMDMHMDAAICITVDGLENKNDQEGKNNF